ncbi:Methylsterol monooxygenase [Seminavis robusta]|uniref:Methylsterol monooxygenase n=1 Tax=Seminavis robusta TaxID=568900 RepID=A0A9N8EET4_9STRA|nr:Methylsterol monooxygenase [Seminavis robusta]|eukprot:Sro1019_g232010.1 Methylsterol monooxygenase (281) ;mRNA; f:25718-26968
MSVINDAYAGPSWERLTTQQNLLGVAGYLVVVVMGFSFVTNRLADESNPKLPVRGKHLDDLNKYDKLYQKVNKVLLVPWVLLGLRCAWYDPSMLWEMKDASPISVLLPMPLYFIIYDFFYTTIHMLLHLKGVYAYVHKHHHRQKAPSRGSEDAVNVHPIEFCLGRLSNIITLYLVCRVAKFHIIGFNLVQLIYTTGSTFSHSRHDITISLGPLKIWTSRDHDVHHRIPNKNFGRFIKLWDWIYCTYRPYSDSEPINPKAQLNPATGKSYEYEKLNAKKQT